MYSLLTKTSWQKQPTRIDLQDITEAMPRFPLIERKFFDDLIELCRKKEHYFVEMGLQKVISPQKKELDPDFWILIWAVDFRDRVFQILIERHPSHGGKGAIAAVGPKDFFEFISSMKKNAILPTLTLINTPEKMKKVGVIVSRPKSYMERRREKKTIESLKKFEQWINKLKATPNVRGQWFPSFKPTCPVCGEQLLEVPGYEVGMNMLVCPRCGAVKPVPRE